MSGADQTAALLDEVERLTEELASMKEISNFWMDLAKAMKKERDLLLPLTTAKDICEKIVRVNAMDYEYRAWARAAMEVISEGN